MSRVVVTGANGFIGTWTVGELLKRGYDVVAIDVETERLTRKFGENPGLSIFQVDVLDEKLHNFIGPGDKVLHLAAVAHFITREKVVKAVQVNVAGTCNVLEACINSHAERIVYSSTGSVYAPNVAVPIRENGRLGPTPENYYGWTKLQAEHWIRVYSPFPHIILRYGYVYGALKDWGAIGDWIYHKIPKGESPEVYGGHQTNDFVYVKDVVDANLLALESKHLNETYNIGTGRANSILDVCDSCIRLAGSTLKPRILPARRIDWPVFVYDISKARAILGYEPKWPIEKGIEDMISHIPERT